MWYNKNDEKYLQPFLNELYDKLREGNKVFRFSFNNEDKVIVKYNCEADTDNGLELDDSNYEEFYEIYFVILKVENKSKDSNLRKNEYISINYHNIPQKWEVVEESAI